MTIRSTGRPGRARHTVSRLSGADGNERLTAITGAVLLVLLAVEGATIVRLGPLLPVHFFVGMLLIGPVLLKACSTCYRFARYYTGAPAYRGKGPPHPLLRVIGPFVLLTSLAVLGTGVALAFAGPGSRDLLFLHKASFVLWFCVMTVHVLAYVWRIPGLVAADLRGGRVTGRAGRGSGTGPAGAARGAGWDGPAGRPTGTGRDGTAGAGMPLGPAGRAARWVAVAVALICGLLLAAATLHLAVPWQHGAFFH